MFTAMPGVNNKSGDAGGSGSDASGLLEAGQLQKAGVGVFDFDGERALSALWLLSRARKLI